MTFKKNSNIVIYYMKYDMEIKTKSGIEIHKEVKGKSLKKKNKFQKTVNNALVDGLTDILMRSIHPNRVEL